MQGIDKTVAQTFQLDFKVENTAIRSAFFLSLEMALVDMIHKETLDIILMKNFDRLPH